MSDLLSELGRLTSSDEESESAWDAKLAEINGTAPAEPDTQPEPEAEAPAEADTAEPEGQPRDEHGRFTRVDTPEVDEHEKEAEPEAQEQAAETESDDPVARYLSKYNGDVGKALRAAAEAQSLIGRKESERSAAETQLQELQARLDQLEQSRTEAQPQYARQITEADVERLDSLAMTDGMRAFQDAMQLDPSGQLGQRVFDTWAAVAPGQASAFLADQIAEAKINALRAELEPVKASNQQASEQAEFVQVWGQLKSVRPDVELLAPAMERLLDENEPLAKAINDADAGGKLALLTTLADAAKTQQDPHVQEAIAQFEREQADSSRAAKVAATVTSPGAVGSPPGGGAQPEKTQAQLEADAIKARIIDTPDTSISSGWTTE